MKSDETKGKTAMTRFDTTGLKVWAAIVFLSGIGAYLWGCLSGEFRKGGALPYGDSPVAVGLVVFALVCLLLGVALVILIFTLEGYQPGQGSQNDKSQ